MDLDAIALSELVAAQRRADALERELSSETARADAAEGALEAVTRQLVAAVARERDDGVLEEKDEEIARLGRQLEDLRDLPRIDEREVRRSAAIRVVSQPLLELETLDGLTDREIMSAVLESRGIAALMRSDAYVLGRFAAEVGRPWLAREDAGEREDAVDRQDEEPESFDYSDPGLLAKIDQRINLLQRRFDAGEFDEDLHPRAGDGKFGSGGGSAAGPKAAGGTPGGVMAKVAAAREVRTQKAMAAAKVKAVVAAKTKAKPAASGKGPPAEKVTTKAKGSSPAKIAASAAKVERTGAKVIKANEKILASAVKVKAAAKTAKEHQSEAKTALKAAKTAVTKAKSADTAKATKSAQTATNKAERLAARATKSSEKHLAAAESHVKAREAHAKATEAHKNAKEAHAELKPGKPSVVAKVSPAVKAKVEAAREQAKPEAAKIVEKANAIAERSDQFRTISKEEHQDRARAVDALPTPQRNAVHKYQGAAYEWINRDLRKSSGHPSDSNSEDTKNIDDAIATSKLSHDQKLFRFVGDDMMKVFSAMKPGQTFQDHGFVSTASDPLGSAGFGRTRIEIDAPAGNHGLHMAGPEREVLLPRGSKFVVNRIEHGTLDVAGRPVPTMRVHVTLQKDNK